MVSGNMGGSIWADNNSHNVANSGNYSIQVLSRALQQFGGFECVPLSVVKN